MADPIATYDAFWPYYLREHADPNTRLVHAIGTILGVSLLATGLLFGPAWLMLAGIVVGYASAWGAHMLIERNRPTTFTYPWWSLRSDFRLVWLMLNGRLDPHLRAAGL